MEFKAEMTINGRPMAILYDGAKVVAKVYLSPDLSRIRFALPELMDQGQLNIRIMDRIIDFRRKL